MKYMSVFLLVFSMFFLGSCFYIQVEYPPERERAPVEEFHKNVPFSPGGTLSLSNVNGNVEIHGWEKEELEVYAEKMIQIPDKTKLYVFPRNSFTPGIVFDKFENFVKIRTKNGSEEKDFGFVDYFVDVPHSINLKDILSSKGDILISEVYGDAYLDLLEGDITVENFSGSLTASTIRGSISASLFDLREQDKIVITSREGNITLTLQEKSSAHLVIACPEGEISSEFEIDMPPGAKNIDTEWGENGPLISLTALRGDIRINKAFRD
jgi:DUF4097 and DUF4098 domain-containing protein YvlB